MRFLRSRFCGRVFSILFLLLFVHSLFTPYYALALTSGPHQPEYTSYEDAGSTDMVNLLTGDFNFNLPLIDVPSPEGNFSMPLSYHAGIGLEQEASWTGLGWNMNPGSILRDINQYPDDASGESNLVTVQDLTGVTGWNRMFNHPFRDDWNSQTGYHGNVNLLDIVEVDFGSKTSVGIVGVHVGDGGVTFDPVQFSMAVINVVSWGVGSAGTTAVSVAKQAAIGLAVSTAVSFAMPVNAPGSPTSGYHKYSKSSSSSVHNHIGLTAIHLALTSVPVPFVSKKKSYRIWLDQSRSEAMYGVLNLSDINPSLVDFNTSTVKVNNGVAQPLKAIPKDDSNRGPASDMNFIIKDELYTRSSSPNVLATDDYTVNAPAVSGSITPYRMDIGSLSMPRQMSRNHARFVPLPYLDYKVPFIYENSLSNQYFYHSGGTTSPTSPSFYHGINADVDFPLPPQSLLNAIVFDFQLTDQIFEQRIRPDLEPLKKVPQANNIEWFRNDEINAPLSNFVHTGPRKFIDFLSAEHPTDYQNSDRYKFRSNNMLGTTPLPLEYPTYVANFNYYIPIGETSVLSFLTVNSTLDFTIWDEETATTTTLSSTITAKDNGGITIAAVTGLEFYLNKPVNISFTYYYAMPFAQLQNGIGGYSITSADGTTYHFAIPVYNYNFYSESVLVSDANKKSKVNRKAPFANTWLLTAITGADFVDRNANGLADGGDWGYWVKFNYGKKTDAFNWRIPYTGEMKDATGTFKSFESGTKQLYYLNTIETRSHVALFMKSEREDGKSVGGSVAPLKLDEICLLKKEQYKKLLTINPTVPDFSSSYASLCLSTDFIANSARDFINKNCLKRVVFQYSYDLCKNTPNAGGPNNALSGKLTLKEITVKGRNDFSVAPSFKFEYAINPSYNTDDWDGWGMYNVNGNSAFDSHATTNISASSASAWSLSKIITPLGGEIGVNYERDSYSSISGEPAYQKKVLFNTTSNTGTAPIYYLDLFSHNLAVGDKVLLKGEISYSCPGSTSPDEFSSSTKVASIDGNRVTFDDSFATPSCTNSGSGSVNVSGTIYQGTKKGGNIRVASIQLRDPNGRINKLRYLYEDNGLTSSGVVSQEPEYIRTTSYPFYEYLKYPQTPVMYGKVSVLSGKLTTDSDFNSKQVFEFETPHKSLLSIQGEDMDGDPLNKLDEYMYKIEDRTSKIGKLKSIKIYDVNNTVTSESRMEYTDHVINGDGVAFQGVFSEGTLLTDYSKDNNSSVAVNGNLKLNRTTVLTYPYTLKRVVNSKDGFTSTVENLKWDLLTGAATEQLSKSSLGVYLKTVSRPAYKFYPKLGSMAYNETEPALDYKNMLLQNAATYVYRSDPMGSSLGLVSAEAHTWKNNWPNYRDYNGSGYLDTDYANSAIWRKTASYAWAGDYLRLQQNYGTHDFAPANEFNFTELNSNAGWLYLGENKRFDHFGMPLESVDRNGICSAIKMGYDGRTIIASASNAKYNEIAFSSAEDKIPTLSYFGGEVALGSGTLVSSAVHTGKTALSLSNGYGFVFKSVELITTKSYRASVWANSTNGRIYYKLNNGAEVVASNQTISQAVAIPGMGNWYRIDLTITNPSSSNIEIGVKSNSGTVIFDDFRFQPADAVMTCSVGQPLDFEFTDGPSVYSPTYAYTLDNDNLFTKMEINEKGEVVKAYSETLKYGVKLISESKTNYRRNTITQ